MVERCSCCRSHRSVQPWRVSHGFESICNVCHRERRASAKPRRTRPKPPTDLCQSQLLFPFMSQNESGPVLSDNNQAETV
jgi:recombinational DNA repair protein (RecF pathway)